ncbi:amidase [Janibacter limosus]|uniref:amidase n=1 Tax=Janibacter limosus TaxID=53458 RepID=UPI00082F5ED8|nr:amidase [Janibacter limosus]
MNPATSDLEQTAVVAHDGPLWQWSAADLAAAIAAGAISSREATQSCLDRIAEVNPHLNAIVAINDEALADADQADRAIADGEHLGPLHGVPIATKVNTDQARMATTEGVTAWKDNVVPSDGPTIRRLRHAGAILLGRTNTPALSFRWFTDNDLHGRTLNPWDPTVTPGGSSGGASSAVASGMVALAQGTDIGGSVRYPAHCCGLVGLRPTVGRVPSWNGPDGADQGLMFQLMNAQGVLGRTVRDVRLGLTAMSGFDPRDPTVSPLDPNTVQPVQRPVRVTLVRDVGIVAPCAEVNAALDQAAEWLTAAGYHVEEAPLPLLEEAFRLWYLLCLSELGTNIGLVEEFGDEGMKMAATYYSAMSQEWWGPQPDLTDFIHGYQRRGTLIRRLQEHLVDSPLVLLPVSAARQFPHDADILDAAGMKQTAYAQWPMMAIPTLGFPAASVPTGIVDGLPIGVQLLGRRMDEATVLDAAEVIESRAGRFTPIDPR